MAGIFGNCVHPSLSCVAVSMLCVVFSSLRFPWAHWPQWRTTLPHAFGTLNRAMRLSKQSNITPNSHTAWTGINCVRINWLTVAGILSFTYLHQDRWLVRLYELGLDEAFTNRTRSASIVQMTSYLYRRTVIKTGATAPKMSVTIRDDNKTKHELYVLKIFSYVSLNRTFP